MQRLDLLFESTEKLVRQTDGLGFIASLAAVFQLDLHDDLLANDRVIASESTTDATLILAAESTEVGMICS